MKKYVLLLTVLLVGLLLTIVGLDLVQYSQDPRNDKDVVGTELWCDNMVDTPNHLWTEHTTQLFAQHCINQ